MTHITKPENDARKLSNFKKAVEFAKQLKSYQTPKKTILISLMNQYGLKVREARAALATGEKHG